MDYTETHKTQSGYEQIERKILESIEKSAKDYWFLHKNSQNPKKWAQNVLGIDMTLLYDDI